MIPRVYKSEYDVSPAWPAWLEQLSTLLELQISSFQNQLFIVNKSDLAQNQPNNIAAVAGPSKFELYFRNHEDALE